MDAFQARIDSFLSMEKAAARRYRWRVKSNKEFVEAKAIIRPAGEISDDMEGMLIMTAHRYRNPRKYSYLHRDSVLRLDVDPARSHTNVRTMTVVRGTHWHTWPCIDGEPDGRQMGHSQWFREFLRRASIRYSFPYDPPPIGMQLELLS